MKKSLLLILFLIPITFLFAQEQKETKPTTIFKLGGYVKGDYLITQYNNGEVAKGNFGRDFHFPGTIPIGNTNVNTYTDFHTKESRFNLGIENNKFGKPIKAFFELDFMLSQQGNTVVSNSFVSRLRHFYFTWNNILVGQTWSTFMIVVIPEELDFIGASEGVVFARQPMVRYTKGSWQFALENPTTRAKFNDGIRLTNQATLPDAVIRKNFKGNWGTWSVAAMGRQLVRADSIFANSNYGFGLTTGGKIKVGAKGDDFRMMLTYGSGMGRYIGLGLSASSTVNESDVKNIETMNGYVAYNHYWAPKLCSSASYSYFMANNDAALTGMDANRAAYSASINLKYKPVPTIWFGAEYSHGYREIEDGTSGSFDRLQISAKYFFGYENFKHIYEK